MTFTDHLARQFNLCESDALALEHTAERLAGLGQDPLFLAGLKAWTQRTAEKLVDEEAAQGKEPSAYALGQRSELRGLPVRLAEIVRAVVVQRATFNRPETQRHDSAAVSP